MNRRSILLLCAAVFVGLGSAAGCAESTMVPSKERLMERVAIYWDAVSARDFSTIYQMETGSLDGSLTPEAVRRWLGRSRLERYEIKEVNLDGNTAVVMIERVHGLEGIKAPITSTQGDTWTFVDGDWYHGRLAKP
jgi:hypothetical protein